MNRLKEKLLNKRLSRSSILPLLLMITAFNIVLYQGFTQLFLANDRYQMKKDLRSMTKVLSKESELTTSVLVSLFNADHLSNVDGDDQDQSSVVLENDGLSKYISSEQTVAIFDADKHLLLTTDSDSSQSEDLLAESSNYHRVGTRGYYLTTKVVSEKTHGTIGYVIVFQDLKLYEKTRRYLLLFLIMLEVVALIVILLLFKRMTKPYLKPLEDLKSLAETISSSPEETGNTKWKNPLEQELELLQNANNYLEVVADYTKHQSQAISEVSHELRTPVAIIKGHLGLLKRWGKEDSTILQESLDVAYDETEKMSMMIDEILDSIRFQNEVIENRDQKTDLKASIEKLLEKIRVVYPDVSFNVSLPENKSIMANIYQHHFEQLMLILIDNGVKYSTKIKRIHITLELSDKQPLLKIRDEGNGMAKEEINYIFERFYRSDTSQPVSEVVQGLGIGLNVLKQIAEVYRLKVTVNSVIDEGTEFKVLFPECR